MERVKLFIEGNLIVKYGYKMGGGKISLQQKKEDFEYEKLIEGDYVYNGEIGDIALSGSVTFLRKGGLFIMSFLPGLLTWTSVIP